MPGVSLMPLKTEAQYQIEEDARTLQRASDVIRNKIRFSKAMGYLKTEVKHSQQVVEHAGGLRKALGGK